MPRARQRLARGIAANAAKSAGKGVLPLSPYFFAIGAAASMLETKTAFDSDAALAAGKTSEFSSGSFKYNTYTTAGRVVVRSAANPGNPAGEIPGYEQDTSTWTDPYFYVIDTYMAIARPNPDQLTGVFWGFTGRVAREYEGPQTTSASSAGAYGHGGAFEIAQTIVPIPEPGYNSPPQATPAPRPKQSRVHRSRQNIAIQINPNGSVDILHNVPPKPPRTPDGKRIREKKGQLSFKGYKAIKKIIDGVGEGLEVLGILSDASGVTSTNPFDQFEDLFIDGQIRNLEVDQLIKGIVLNEIEDRFYGKLGDFSKESSRKLNRTVGFQTGIAL